eukprot:2922984-Pyramimonas_sp.AAC.1
MGGPVVFFRRPTSVVRPPAMLFLYDSSAAGIFSHLLWAESAGVAAASTVRSLDTAGYYCVKGMQCYPEQLWSIP